MHTAGTVRMTLRHRETILYVIWAMYTKSVVSFRDLINNMKHVCSNFLRYSRAARLLDGHKQKKHLSSLYMHSYVLNFRSGLAFKMDVKCKCIFTLRPATSIILPIYNFSKIL